MSPELIALIVVAIFVLLVVGRAVESLFFSRIERALSRRFGATA